VILLAVVMGAGSLKMGLSFLQRHNVVGLFSSFKQTESSPATRAPGEEPIRRADMTAVPVGSGWHAVSLRGGLEAGQWPSFAVDFLAGCSEFKPLSEHLREYSRYHSLDSGQVHEINQWAGQMIDGGLLIGVRRLVDRCVAAGVSPDRPARVDSICIPTAGHAERLRRVITSFARNARQYGRELKISVSSNGPAESAAATRGLIDELARAESVKITLLDDADRQQYAVRLAERAGVDPMIAEFAIGDPFGAGFACGANRNALLLRHSGQAYLSLDDDMVCEMASAPEKISQDGLVVFSSRDGFERWFYPEYAQAFDGRRMIEGDYLALHEQMLGHSVGAFMARQPKVDLIGITDDMLRRLQETDGRILATFTGHSGHPGIPTSYYYLTYRQESLERLTCEGEARYRAYLRSGGVCAVVPRMAIADASLSPGMAIGIDARALVPPFPPVMHAEDFVWGATIWQCCAAAFAGHLPVTVRHDPGVGRGIIAPPIGGQPVAMWEFAHLLRGMLLGWMPPPGSLDTAVRMDSLGRYLCDVAGAPAAEFHEYLRWFVLGHESEKIAFMETCLEEEREAPIFWRRDIEDYIEQTRRALTEPDFDIPYDMREKWAAKDARVLIQRMVREYGRLLRAWPVLVEAAGGME
jgi:hypothetical protein